MKNLILIAMLVLGGSVFGQVNLKKVTNRQSYYSYAQTDLCSVEDMNEVFTECKTLLEKHGLDINDPEDYNRTEFFSELEFEDYKTKYMLLTGDHDYRSWSIDSGSNRFFYMVFFLADEDYIEMRVEKVRI